MRSTRSNRDPSLVDVVSSVDAINHDVVSYDDFVRRVGLLRAANVVRPSYGLRLTRAGQALLKPTGRGSWHEPWQVIEERLEQLDAEARTSVTAEAFDDAVRRYLGRHG